MSNNQASVRINNLLGDNGKGISALEHTNRHLDLGSYASLPYHPDCVENALEETFGFRGMAQASESCFSDFEMIGRVRDGRDPCTSLNLTNEHCKSFDEPSHVAPFHNVPKWDIYALVPDTAKILEVFGTSIDVADFIHNFLKDNESVIQNYEFDTLLTIWKCVILGDVVNTIVYIRLYEHAENDSVLVEFKKRGCNGSWSSCHCIFDHFSNTLKGMSMWHTRSFPDRVIDNRIERNTRKSNRMLPSSSNKLKSNPPTVTSIHMPKLTRTITHSENETWSSATSLPIDHMILEQLRESEAKWNPKLPKENENCQKQAADSSNVAMVEEDAKNPSTPAAAVDADIGLVLHIINLYCNLQPNRPSTVFMNEWGAGHSDETVTKVPLANHILQYLSSYSRHLDTIAASSPSKHVTTSLPPHVKRQPQGLDSSHSYESCISDILQYTQYINVATFEVQRREFERAFPLLSMD